ncbi:hypothetical protein AJ79_05602 [Helicocarpus griseus UAMH5409]|uniref:FHA domain-containing protein n=1 Tax=Helicocarpus griseus UAMH5409 TaxID=1447875 RepID=A0A2B7XLQ0_9EURO|nr:hypothetical protein AJ79_05602 [Helicocarpus griseus UAMH5409]
MTAVASPPSVQSGPRLGWYPAVNGGQGALNPSSSDEGLRMFMPRKSVQRTNSSSSLNSNSSSTTAIPANSQHSNASQASNESGTAPSKKKPYKYSSWSNSKAEPVAGVTNARSQAVSAPPSGTTASSAMSALHQPSPIVPSQHVLQPQQQNNARLPNGALPNDPPAILSLLPINGTFERKQITVPYYPEVLRIGRQTNAKTVPTQVNGYFDSKVLSRQHAEVWADRAGKIWIRDVKSSNGTFVNGQRLSPENRDSEPHELREHDTLELGIDIVSEDQKSIVHHKVSAKVEHAGVYGPNMNILDLNLGDIDPTAGGGLLPSHLSQPLSHMRGRPGSSASMGSNRSGQSAAGNQLGMLRQQRQMNYWLSPVSIEQVVKRLSSEMKQAKQQTHDLNQTNNFLSHLVSHELVEKERAKLSPVETHNNNGRLLNGRPKMPKVDQISRFSDPPAPPPQQPLPEKPDALPRGNPESLPPSGLKRSDTEKPKGPASTSANRESSQILSLIEALSNAKKDLDAQGARVKELEQLLLEERAARAQAEERARNLEGQTIKQDAKSEVEAAFELSSTPDDSTTVAEQETVVLPPQAEVSKQAPDSALSQAIKTPPDVTSEQLQRRIDNMIADMDEMRKQVAKYKQCAEKAESEAFESRKTLAEMIETIRNTRIELPPDPSAGTSIGLDSSHSEADSLVDAFNKNLTQLGSQHDTSSTSHHLHLASKDGYETYVKQRHKTMLDQSTPYASMLGVVLLGVGIMAYLNGWQKGDR